MSDTATEHLLHHAPREQLDASHTLEDACEALILFLGGSGGHDLGVGRLVGVFDVELPLLGGGEFDPHLLTALEAYRAGF